MGSEFFKQECVRPRTTIWIEGLTLLSKIVRIDPQSVSACFISGYKHKLNKGTISNILELSRDLNKILQKKFIPAIISGITCSE